MNPVLDEEHAAFAVPLLTENAVDGQIVVKVGWIMKKSLERFKGEVHEHDTHRTLYQGVERGTGEMSGTRQDGHILTSV
jgi:hypothetical protein